MRLDVGMFTAPNHLQRCGMLEAASLNARAVLAEHASTADFGLLRLLQGNMRIVSHGTCHLRAAMVTGMKVPTL